MGCLNGRNSPAPPAAPDNSGLIDAINGNAEMQFEMSQKYMDIMQGQLDWAKVMGQWQMDTTKKVLDIQLPIMKEQGEWAREDRERWETVFKPLEDELIQEAKAFDSPGRREEAAARATADVTRAFDAQRENSRRELESYGIDPSQVRTQALDRNVRIAQGAAQAGASTNAKRQVEAEGRALKGNVVSMGRGLPMQAVNTGASASNVGSQAVGGVNQTVNAGANARQVGASYGGLANQAIAGSSNSYNQAAGIINSGYRNQLDAWSMNDQMMRANQSDAMGGLGTAVGLAAAFFAEGGEAGQVAEAQGVGTVDGAGGPKSDAVPALLSDDEYVIPAEIVHYKGTEFFDKLINKSHEGMGIPPEVGQMQNGVPTQGGEQNG